MAKIWVSAVAIAYDGRQQAVDRVVDAPFNDICCERDLAEVRRRLFDVLVPTPSVITILNWKALLY